MKELHTKEDIESIAKWIKGAERYFLQSFVDSGDLIGENLSAHTPETMEEMRSIAALYTQNVGVRGI